MASAVQTVRLIAGAWDSTFGNVVSLARDRLILCAPFISPDGARAVASARKGQGCIGAKSLTLTDLSPRAVCAGATDPSAVASVGATLKGSRVVHLPRLHAKVYVADGRRAVVTSGNLTSGGLGRNYEYGVLISDDVIATRVESDVLEYAGLGAEIDESTLATYCEAATDARKAYAQQVASASRVVQQRLASSLNAANDTLLRARLAGGAMHTVFAKTIAFLLRRHGPLTTRQLHPMVQQLHPDLCDDTVDRVIDGQHFGKKWKHAVRTAQQQLKKTGTVRLVGDKWLLVS